jgi:nucleotide-binding universal stress UspA family protein
MSWLPKNSVVVPVDFSDDSIGALDAALEFVENNDSLHVIHVLPVLEPAEPGVIWNTIDDSSRTHHATAALKERLADAKYKGIDIHIAFGDPGHQIAEFADQVKAELLVMPSHGRTGLKRILMGSVAERTIRLSHCPVLVLRHV